MSRIVIAGGGITGLAAAYYISKRAQAAGATPEIILVERDEKLGGQVQTQHVDGMIFEEAPDSFLMRKPWMAQLCKELGLELVGTNPDVKKTYILNNGELEPIPAGMQLFIPTNIKAFAKSKLVSQNGKMRALLEPLVPIRTEETDEALGDFIARRFGREMLDKIGAPLTAGVYGGDPYELSIKATFPQFAQMERTKGSLLKAVRKAAPAQGTTGSAFQTVATGLYSVVEAIMEATPDVKYLTGVSMETVAPQEGGGYQVSLSNGEDFTADAVVLTLPGYATAGLVESFLPAVAAELNAIEYASVVVAVLAYDRADVYHPLDATGFLAPKGEPLPISATTWFSTKWPHSAPEDKVIIRGFLGRPGEDWTKESDETIIQAVKDSLAQVIGLTAEPLHAKVFRWTKSRPRYKIGHLERVDRIEAAMQQAPGLYLAGTAYRGAGLPDCVKQAGDAAEQVAKQLGWA